MNKLIENYIKKHLVILSYDEIDFNIEYENKINIYNCIIDLHVITGIPISEIIDAVLIYVENNYFTYNDLTTFKDNIINMINALNQLLTDSKISTDIIDLRELNQCNKNKKEYELSIINKHIINICKGYNVEYVCLEDLNIMTNNKGNGKTYNKLVNNDWNRNYFVNNLIKWLNINDIKHIMVNPYYTSFIGQIKNEKDYDSIAASKEIALRGYLIKNGIKIRDYINEFLCGLVTTRWKEMLPNINTYQDLYNYFKTKKKSRNSYRFLFNDIEKLKWSYLRLGFYESKVDLIRF